MADKLAPHVNGGTIVDARRVSGIDGLNDW